MTNERLRQSVHIALFVFAFLLRYVSRWQAAGILLLLLLAVIIVSPKIKSKIRIHRPNESHYRNGAVLYFLVLLALVVIFPPTIVAVTWAVLALGDGAATLVGTHFTARPLPWNDRKTLAGSTAFLIFGTLGASILLRWMMPELEFGKIISASLKASFAAAIVESLPWKINDNVSVAITAAIVFSLVL